MHGRRVFLGLVLFLTLAVGAWAKAPVRPAAELDQLLGPIALYPDPLLAQLLPAATAPDDLALAVSYLENGGDLGQVDGQPWNDNAKALARYPEVLRMMHRSRDWTNAVGAAFLDQPKEVMDSIQRLRNAALASGALQTTNEQRVTAEKGLVYIYPSDPTSISLPQYDPDLVYLQQPAKDGAAPITFGSVLLVGYWLHYELDWRKHRVYSYDYQEFPYGRRNPWYFGGQNTGQVPPNLPKQPNHEWKPDRKKARPFDNPGEPLPTIKNPTRPAEQPRNDEPARPMTESRPLEAPKDLPPPPPDLTPVDPEMETIEEPPAAKPALPGKAVQKPAGGKAVPSKAVKAKPAAVKAAPANAVKAKPATKKAVPAKTGKARPAATQTPPAKAVKEKTAPATSVKAKPAETKAPAAKSVKAAPAAQKATASKSVKTKPAETKPSSKKQP